MSNFCCLIGEKLRYKKKERKNHQFRLSSDQSDGDISSLVDPVGHFRIIIIINFL